jgi:hypothetical protein
MSVFWSILAFLHFVLVVLALLNDYPAYDALQLAMLFLIASKVSK